MRIQIIKMYFVFNFPPVLSDLNHTCSMRIVNPSSAKCVKIVFFKFVLLKLPIYIIFHPLEVVVRGSETQL